MTVKGRKSSDMKCKEEDTLQTNKSQFWPRTFPPQIAKETNDSKWHGQHMNIIDYDCFFRWHLGFNFWLNFLPKKMFSSYSGIWSNLGSSVEQAHLRYVDRRRRTFPSWSSSNWCRVQVLGEHCDVFFVCSVVSVRSVTHADSDKKHINWAGLHRNPLLIRNIFYVAR